MDSNRLRHIEFTDVEATLAQVHGEKFTRYRREFDSTKDCRFIPDRPLYLILEVNNYCNMLCKMCYKNEMPAHGRIDISDEILNKLCSEMQELGIPSIILGAGTECLIHPNIVKIIEKVKKSGLMDSILITNGYCLTDEIIDKLIELQWERIYISVDAATSDTYKKIRGKDLSVVENNIRNLVNRRNAAGSVLPLVRVSFVVQDDNRDEQEAFFEKWKDIVDIIDYQQLLDYTDLNVIDEDIVFDGDYRCVKPFRLMCIYCDGDILPCSSTYGVHQKIGNIRDITLKEAWDSNVISNIRSDMQNGCLNTVCKNCAAHINFIDDGH